MNITLTKRSVLYLRSVLEAPGWCKNNADVFRGGQLLCEVLPDLKDQPELVAVKTELGVSHKPADQKAFDTWSDEQVTIDLSDKLFKTCQDALTHFSDKSLLNPGKATFELLRVFKLSPE